MPEQFPRASSEVPLSLRTRSVFIWDQLVNADVDNTLISEPQSFDPSNHQGKIEQELLNEKKGASKFF